jgi:hypothetical protein
MTIEMRIACPFCGEVNPLVSEAWHGGPDVPAVGDIAMCFRCGEFGVFGRRGRLRVPTPVERREITRDTDLIRMHAAWRETIK